MSRVGSIAAAAWLVLCGAELMAQTPPVTYTAEVTLVEVDAVVTNRDGHPVRDLRKEDFEVFENGKRQTIDRVSFVEIPIERAGLRAGGMPRDVRTNLQRFEGRLYVLLLDDVQTSAPRAVRVKAAAKRFVAENLEPGDLAAVVHVSGLGNPNQDFTSDARLLLASIDRFVGRKTRSETMNRIDEYNRLRQLRSNMPAPVQVEEVKDPDEAARAHDARGAFEAIAGIGRRLAPVRGRRKALLWFGEGVSYDMFDLARAQGTGVIESARAAVAAATRANVVIYGVDARGLGGVGEEAIQVSNVAQDPTMPFNAAGLQQEMRRSQDHLRRVSNETGGFAVVNTDEFAGAFERVVMENSAYYLLGYYPSESGDGAYRTIQVKVKRPGVSVRARAGYVPRLRSASARQADEAGLGAPAAPREAPERLRDALESPVPQSALPMAAHAAAFRGKGEKASVLVTVEYGAAAFAAPATPAASGDRLQSSVIAVDPLGKVEASDHMSIGFDVKPQTREAMKVLGFRTHARLELPPGRYQLRVAGMLANGLVGSVHKDIEVPDFAAQGVTMSDLAVTSIVAGLVPTAQLDDRMRQALPAPPSATRDFRQDEAMALFVEIYEAGGVPSRDVTFSTTVRGAGGEVVFTRSDRRTADQLKESSGGYTLQVPLRQFAPGDYALRLEAAIGDTPVAREAAFRVWEVPESQSADPQSAVRTPQSAVGDSPVVVIARGAVSGVGDARQAVARSAEELQALWASLPLRSAAPQVAFANTMVVALFLGARPTAGYDAEVVAVRREGDTLIVSWRERAPDPGNPPAETTPFAIVGVPMHAGEVRFERVK